MAGVTASTTDGSKDAANVELLIALSRLGIWDAGSPPAVAAGGTRF